MERREIEKERLQHELKESDYKLNRQVEGNKFKLYVFVAEDCLVIKEIKSQQNIMSHNISGSSN